MKRSNKKYKTKKLPEFRLLERKALSRADRLETRLDERRHADSEKPLTRD